MKKKYSKPVIIFDSFELSQSIAGTCSTISNAAMYDCPVYYPEWDISVFTLQKNCDATPQDYGTPCYEIPYESHNVFSS